MITSLQNPRVKAAIKLRDRNGRRKQQRYLIDGLREISRALDAAVPVSEVFLCEDYSNNAEFRSVQQQLREREISWEEVSASVLEKLSYGSRQTGIIVIAESQRKTFASLSLPDQPLIAILERVEKPGNLGAIIRSADGANVSAVILVDPQTEPTNPNAIRASLGTVFSMPIVSASLRETIDWLTERSFQITITRPEARCVYTDIDYRKPTAIVLGSEAEGLSPEWDQLEQVQRISLPMLGIADSLNVSNTAAILFYEALRQRK